MITEALKKKPHTLKLLSDIKEATILYKWMGVFSLNLYLNIDVILWKIKLSPPDLQTTTHINPTCSST